MGRGTLTRYIVDTHIFLPWSSRKFSSFSKKQIRILKKASAENPVLLSEISLWEIANLVDLGRVRLDLPIRSWLEAAVALPLVECIRISPAIAAEVAALPATFHRDPADRIIVATARIHGATIVTSDERIVRSKIVPCIS